MIKCIYRLDFRANTRYMILNGDGNRKHTGMILIHLQSAFHTLDQRNIIEKLKCISFSDKTIKWFHSSLIKRAFIVYIKIYIYNNIIIYIGGNISLKMLKALCKTKI